MPDTTGISSRPLPQERRRDNREYPRLTRKLTRNMSVEIALRSTKSVGPFACVSHREHHPIRALQILIERVLH